MKTDDAQPASGNPPRLHSFAQQIRNRVSSGSRILEIGAGDGQLAQLLADAGYRVVAMDREQRSAFFTIVTEFESYDPGGIQFDCVAAALVLHHLWDLEAAILKIRSLLAPGGIVAIDDYGWERIDERVARLRWGDAWQTKMQTWKDERADLHRSDAMLQALNRYFAQLSYYDHAYFDDGQGTDTLAFTYFARS